MVILRKNEIPQPVRIEDAAEITYADYIFDDSDDEAVIVTISADESCDDVSPVRHCGYARRRSGGGKAVRRVEHLSYLRSDGPVLKRNMGAKKWRRVENARILSSLMDPDDVCYDSSDLMPKTMSAFARLLSDEAGMRVWQDFMEQTEEEQEEFLHCLEDEVAFTVHLANNSDLKLERGLETGEERAIHPAYSAKLNFQRLDKRFRNALSKRHAPLKLLEELEEDIRAFFAEDPTGVWSKSVGSDYRRFYLHAVAQYLMLRSQSQRVSSRDKKTFVRNPKQSFHPPDEKLHRFLSKNVHEG